MLRFIVNRLLLALPTLWAVLTLVFVLVRVVPGDPATRRARQRAPRCANDSDSTSRSLPSTATSCCSSRAAISAARW